MISFQIYHCQNIESSTTTVEYSVSSSSSTSIGRDRLALEENEPVSDATNFENTNHSREALTQEGNAPESVCY